jgi:hypothetical protein
MNKNMVYLVAKYYNLQFKHWLKHKELYKIHNEQKYGIFSCKILQLANIF